VAMPMLTSAALRNYLRIVEPPPPHGTYTERQGERVHCERIKTNS
jgi:hypothetical protein